MDIPVIALFAGDPAGIGPELTAKLLADPRTHEHAQVIVIGQQAGFDALGADCAKWRIHRWSGWQAPEFERAHAGPANGRFMLEGLREAAELVRAGHAQAMCFAPLNKAALRAGGMQQEDELRWFADLLGHTGVCGELNVLDRLWTARVTSHIALREVSDHLSAEKVAQAIEMVTRALRAAGNAVPRIAVCGLNPHNGDHGNYGDEEARIIGPGVELAGARGFVADGPFAADTAFVRALRTDGSGYDGVVTMYHDQGQIAMKLLGFERGVTVLGGLPIAVCTPAHGTAYDIAGQGRANVGALAQAFDLARRLALRRPGSQAPSRPRGASDRQRAL